MGMRDKRPSKCLAEAMLAVICVAGVYGSAKGANTLEAKIDQKIAQHETNRVALDVSLWGDVLGGFACLAGAAAFGVRAMQKEEYYYTFY